MQNVEHIGIAVKELSVSIPLFEKLLNSKCYKTETVETEKVSTAFFKTGERSSDNGIYIIHFLLVAGFFLRKRNR